MLLIIFENLNEEHEINLPFSKHILAVINRINRKFQSEITEIHNMYVHVYVYENERQYLDIE